MTSERPYLRHLRGSQDLVTTREARRAGFVTAVLEKSRLADEFITAARTLKVKAEQSGSPKDLLDILDIQAGLLTAAGVSDKATAHLDINDRNEVLSKYIEQVLVPAGDKYIEELVYRFLLTRGDTLGGKIRNLVGVWAQRKFSEFVVADLRLAGKDFKWFHKDEARWKKSDAIGDFDQIKAFSWTTGYLPRVLAYNLFVPLIRTEEESLDASNRAEGATGKGGKNVDICLLHWKPEQYTSKVGRPKMVKDAPSYVALGELKGGIDPAGADEHWKTASAHLERIRHSFAGLNPPLFFVGNAIEASMAGEIWTMLETGTLTNAANMTDDRQAVSLISWLCSL